MSKKIIMIFTAVLAFIIAAACTPEPGEPQITPGQPGLPAETPQMIPGTAVGGYTEFVAALEGDGATIELVGEVSQPPIPVTGQAIQVNGADVQVFEFTDAQSRQEAQSTILIARTIIAQTTGAPVNQVQLWGSGRIVVLYVGQATAVITLINNILGPPLTETAMPEEELPAAVAQGIRTLSAEINVAREEFRVVAFEAVDWPDGCLGLAGPDEGCTLAIVPGWRIVLEYQDQQYEVRTDMEGTQVRWQRI